MLTTEMLKAEHTTWYNNIIKHFRTGLDEIKEFAGELMETPEGPEGIDTHVLAKLMPPTKVAELDFKLCHKDIQAIVTTVKKEINELNTKVLQLKEEGHHYDTLVRHLEFEIAKQKKFKAETKHTMDTHEHEVADEEAKLKRFKDKLKEYEASGKAVHVLSWFPVIGPVANLVFNGIVSPHAEASLENAMKVLERKLSSATESLEREKVELESIEHKIQNTNAKLAEAKAEVQKRMTEITSTDKKKEELLKIVNEIAHNDVFIGHAFEQTSALFNRVQHTHPLKSNVHLLDIMVQPLTTVLDVAKKVADGGLVSDQNVHAKIEEIGRMIVHIKEIIEAHKEK